MLAVIWLNPLVNLEVVLLVGLLSSGYSEMSM
jgi:arginine exporter protein ArgO